MKCKNALVLTLILTIVAIGFYIHTKNVELREPLAFYVIAAALITFFWSLSESRSSEDSARPRNGVLQKAIAASLVVEYVVLVGTFAFWGGATEQLAPMTQQLITSFTTIVAVVIAFYFGTSAYVEVKARTKEASSLGAATQMEKQQSTHSSAPEKPSPPIGEHPSVSNDVTTKSL